MIRPIAVSYNVRMKTVIYTADALKDLKRHGNMAARIRKALADYAADPKSHANNVIAMTGQAASRMRVADYRVIFVEADDSLTVVRSGQRGGVDD